MLAIIVFLIGLASIGLVLWWAMSYDLPGSPGKNLEGWVNRYPAELHYVLKDAAGVDSWRFWAMIGLGDGLACPRVRDVYESPAGCKLIIGMLGGQSVTDWESALDAITHGLGVPEVIIKRCAAGVIVLEVRVRDPLLEVLPMPAPEPVPDLQAVHIGMAEGEPWTVSLLYSHWMGAGATGAGKGSVLWSMLCGVAPAIHSGLVQVWGIDPKAMELAKGQALFTRLVDDSGEEALQLLRDAVALMKKRSKSLRDRGIRKHVPTIDEPLLLVVIDEMADLIAYETDRKLRDEALRLIQKLLSQGRAPGVGVVSFVQDPSKETVPFRQLYPGRIGLRLDEPTQVNMVLGQGAKARGAKCDSIPDTLPGVAYVALDGDSAIERVRAFYPDDAAIEAIARMFPAPSNGGNDDEAVA